MKARWLALGAVFLLLLTACSSASEQIAEKIVESESGGQVDISDDGNSISFESDDGSGSVSISEDEDKVVIETETEDGSGRLEMGGTEIPDGFPMPIPDNAEVTNVSSFESDDGNSYTVVLTIEPDDAEGILAMYEDWFNGEGLEVMTGPDSVLATSDATFASASNTNYGDYSEITLGWSDM